jgi:type I restriction enzyme S subunit
MSWSYVPLETVIEDAQPGFASGEDLADGVAQIRMNNLDTDGNLNWDKIRRVPATANQAKKLCLVPGDVLFNSTNSPDLVGKSALFTGFMGAQEPVLFSNHFLRLRPSRARLDSSFLARWLVTQYKTGIFKLRATQWVNQASFRREDLLALQIPLPPLPEQRRIAAILDKADAVRRKRKQAIALTDELLRSAFLDLFGDPVTNPKGWTLRKIGEALDESRGGTRCGPFGTALRKDEYVDAGVPVWGIDNVQPNRFTEDGSLFIEPDKFDDLQAYEVLPGDILISRAGTVGRMCVARPQRAPSIIGTNLIRVSLNPEKMLPEYMAGLFTFFSGRLAGLKANGKDDAYSFMKTGVLREITVPLPPIAQQRRYREASDRISAATRRLEHSSEESQQLFGALSQRAFRGDL